MDFRLNDLLALKQEANRTKFSKQLRELADKVDAYVPPAADTPEWEEHLEIIWDFVEEVFPDSV